MSMIIGSCFTGWPVDATALLAEIGRDNSREFFAAHRSRYDAVVSGPMRALAVELEGEFGPVRVLRPWRNRRFRPDVPPLRTDVAGVAATVGGAELSVVLSASRFTVAAGRTVFDPGQLRRFRACVDADDALPRLLTALDGGLVVQPGPLLRHKPRAAPVDHPRLDLLRRRGLLVGRSWAVGAWLGSDEPLDRIRAAWRAAEPFARWWGEHVGPAEPAPPRVGQRARQ